MHSIAFATYRLQPHLNSSDLLLAQKLQEQGYNVAAVPWDKKINWKQFETVILRSCWNYPYHYSEFLLWLSNLENSNTIVLNPLPIIRWNSHKSYLLELSKQGVIIPPTKLIYQKTKTTLKEQLAWEVGIIKPAVGSAAYNVFRIEKQNSHNQEKQFQKMLSQGDIIIQQYLPQITQGEISLVFFRNTFSHAVIKVPKAQQFIAHPRFGVVERLITPPNAVIETGKNILKRLSHPVLYARVDGLIIHDTFVLMELELIEPLLFIDFSPSSAQLFAQSYMRMTA